MWKKLAAVSLGALFLSGCSVQLPFSVGGGAGGSFWKSIDAGNTFEPKVTIDEEKKIASADVLSLAFHPTNSEIIYIGTLGSGLFKTIDAAETWTPMVFPPVKNYGLAIDPQNGDRLYASGVYENVSKVYRTDDAGENWKEIYTEPGPGTVITALELHPNAPQVLYASTSAGVVIRSQDGGETWTNIVAAKGPVTEILLERGSMNTVTLLVFNMGTMTSTNGGETWEDFAAQTYVAPQTDTRAGSVVGNTTGVQKPQNITTLAADPGRAGVIYAGAKNGLYRSTDYGRNWQPIDVIESAKKFPTRAIAINPTNSNEIIFAAGRAFYKSIDGGVNWATTELQIDRGVSVLRYDPFHPETIYFGLRKF